MKKSVIILISLLLLINCGKEDEEICPECRKLFPGVYSGSGSSHATVKFINNNTYTIEYGSGVYEIGIKDNDNSFVYFDVNIAGENCAGNSNKFVIYENLVSPYIELSFCIQTDGGILGDNGIPIKFTGTKPIVN